MTRMIGLDFETYAAVDLTVHGLARYIRCPHFTPLRASITEDGMQPIRLDFVNNFKSARFTLNRELTDSPMIVAHNAAFEQAVLGWLGFNLSAPHFIDSAVVARAAGAAGKLEAAAPQLLNVDKMEAGRNLIRLFSIPGEYQAANGNNAFDPQVVEDYPDQWEEFGDYCEVDSHLGLQIAMRYFNYLTKQELEFQTITMEMNQQGWCVDMSMVREMQQRYQNNQFTALLEFKNKHNADTLNLNSLKQLKEWCLDRGVKALSFDEKNVARMIPRIEKRIETEDNLLKVEDYTAVLDMLRTKQLMGGSSLKKLQTIIDTAVPVVNAPSTAFLYDQYLHCGAGQSLRTTGRSTQMQNLKRLGENPDDMQELEDPGIEWDNDKLSKNMRQLFTSRHKGGRLIVGDLKSVESMGLAWSAGEQWKLDAYRQGKDVYKLLAQTMYPGLAYDAITASQRQLGKTGELSCGYQAGGAAVAAFSESMGAPLTEEQATKLVTDWRLACPKTVGLWLNLDGMLHDIIEGGHQSRLLVLADGFRLFLEQVQTPVSLTEQHPGAQSIRMRVASPTGDIFMLRYFHGCYARGRSICYYKPSELKSGDLWRSHFRDPKSKELKFFSIYGGKLAGILTQSLCREIFFRVAQEVRRYCMRYPQTLQLIGQFHDELVVDWKPGGTIGYEDAEMAIESIMSDFPMMPSFPLAASVKSSYRYIK